MKEIKEYILLNRENIVNDLIELIKIPSVADTEYAKKALEFICELFEKSGIEAKEYKTYALAKMGEEKHTIGLFSHADVVPAGNDWTVCKPFEPNVKEGYIFGRGAWDDKSAVIISLYAMKIIKELNIALNSTVVAFVGGNEETTMSDITDYKKAHTLPSVSMVLDAAFPVYLGDKGMLWLQCEKKGELEDLIELNGGEAINITLKNAKAKVRQTKELYDELTKNNEIHTTSSTEIMPNPIITAPK